MDTGPVSVDYAAVVADMKRRIEELQRALAVIEALQASGALMPLNAMGSTPQGGEAPLGPLKTGAVGPPSPNPPVVGPDGRIEVRSDEFFGMSISAAAQRYLAMKKKPAGTVEIADALERGGFPHQSAKLANTAHTVLTRNSVGASPIFAKVKRGTWGLAIWYGNRRPDKGDE